MLLVGARVHTVVGQPFQPSLTFAKLLHITLISINLPTYNSHYLSICLPLGLNNDFVSSHSEIRLMVWALEELSNPLVLFLSNLSIFSKEL
jgi:hypothetical protein